MTNPVRYIKYFLLPASILLITAVIPSVVVAQDECSKCHSDWISTARSRPVVHPPFDEGDCSSCHEEHGADGRLVLLEEGEALCLQCHDVPDSRDTVVHTAVSDGGCTDCHLPHAGDRPKLLVDEYTTKRYPKGFSEKMYTLCFDCHDASLVTGPAESTGFRDGNKNLHNVHVRGAVIPNKYGIVRRGKARSCSLCHDPHGSTQDYNLISTYSNNGISVFSLTYTSLEDGGKCMVGCHKPRSYHRTSTTTVVH